MNDAAQIASTILAQLGGRRFLAMTGARALVATEGGLQFKFPNRSPRPNCCEIVLTDDDLYSVTFYRLSRQASVAEMTRVTNQAPRSHHYYADQLQEVFTRETGLDTHL